MIHFQSYQHEALSLLLPKRNFVSKKSDATSWVDHHVSVNNWLACIDTSFLKDNFNLYGISSIVPNFQLALKLILDENIDEEIMNNNTEVREDAEMLYGLIHARYILTPPGLTNMKRKYEAGIFGQCPRFQCLGQNLLPVGLSSKLNHSSVKVFCPKCGEIYHSNSDLDGAYFGPSFPHFFQQINRETLNNPKVSTYPIAFCGVPLS